MLNPGDLLALADRELMEPLDQEARRTVLAASKRVAMVAAISPMAWIAMLYVLIENLRMLRAIAGLYGGRPGPLGALRLARMVVGHIIATGGVALTDDLLGQFLGQDLLRRLSRRLGEGAFNGALTARVGAAAVEVCRPLPFIAAPPIRARDMLAEAFRRVERADGGATSGRLGRARIRVRSSGEAVGGRRVRAPIRRCARCALSMMAGGERQSGVDNSVRADGPAGRAVSQLNGTASTARRSPATSRRRPAARLPSTRNASSAPITMWR